MPELRNELTHREYIEGFFGTSRGFASSDRDNRERGCYGNLGRSRKVTSNSGYLQRIRSRKPFANFLRELRSGLSRQRAAPRWKVDSYTDVQKFREEGAPSHQRIVKAKAYAKGRAMKHAEADGQGYAEKCAFIKFINKAYPEFQCE